MTAIDAFLATWSHTRRAFGDGTPVGGAHYDGSGSLRQVEASLASAGPGSHWSGSAATNYDDANIELRRVIGQLAELDQRLVSEIDWSAQVVESGRRDLEDVRQRVIAAAAAVPEIQAGERMRFAIAQTGLAQLQEIIQRSNAEFNAIGERSAASARNTKRWRTTGSTAQPVPTNSRSSKASTTSWILPRSPRHSSRVTQSIPRIRSSAINGSAIGNV